MCKTASSDKLRWLQERGERFDRDHQRVVAFLDWTTRTYRKLDTNSWWILPLSIIGFVLFTLVLVLPMIFIAVYGHCRMWASSHLDLMWALRPVWIQLYRFVYCMGLCVFTHLLFIYFGWEQLFATVLGK